MHYALLKILHCTADPAVRRDFERHIAEAESALEEGHIVLEELSQEDAEIQALQKMHKEKYVSA